MSTCRPSLSCKLRFTALLLLLLLIVVQLVLLLYVELADNDDDDKRNNWSNTNFCKLYAPTFNSSAHNYLLTTIHNVIKS